MRPPEIMPIDAVTDDGEQPPEVGAGQVPEPTHAGTKAEQVGSASTEQARYVGGWPPPGADTPLASQEGSEDG